MNTRVKPKVYNTARYSVYSTFNSGGELYNTARWYSLYIQYTE